MRSFFFVFFVSAVVLAFGSLSLAQSSPASDGEGELTRELLELEKKSTTTASAEVLEAGRKGTDEIRNSGILESALNVGKGMPEFTLDDAFGKAVSSTDLLKKGHIVLVFYRGAWCPYCNLYLRGLQKRLSDFESKGAQLVAVSIEPPDRSLAVLNKNKLDFTVLSDPGLKVARQFGIVYELPSVVDDVVKGLGFDIGKYNGTERTELPLAATYVISSKGEIKYAFLEADYKKRADPVEILSILDSLN